MTRASPRRRITASRAGRVVKWTPTQEDWLAIDKSMGVVFDADSRDAIAEIVNSYLYYAPLAKAATFIGKTEEYIRQVGKAATTVEEAIGSLGGVTRLVAIYEIENHLRQTEPNFPSIKDILLLLHKLSIASADVREELHKEDAPSFLETQPWTLMVQRLNALVRELGLPSGVGVGATPSRFTQFIFAIQSGFPPGYARHQTSETALATALLRAL